MKNRKPTSQDIAERAGVSQPTVSRALRNSPLVSEETRSRIYAIARELNYPLDKLEAQGDKKQRNLCVLFAQSPAENGEGLTPFILELLNAITRKAASLDYGIHLGLRHAGKHWNLVLDEVEANGLGVIFIGNHDYMTYKERLLAIHHREIPFTAWGPVQANQVGVFIGSDNLDGGYQATKHLIKLGHERIAFIGNISDMRPEFAARYQGYTKALLQAGVVVDPKLRADAQSNLEDGRDAIKRLYDSQHGFTAAVCASDSIAASVLEGLKELGKRVPDDLALVGFDDIPIARYLSPALTTVKQDITKAGSLLVEHLAHIINGSELSSLELPVELMVRQSCGSIA